MGGGPADKFIGVGSTVAGSVMGAGVIVAAQLSNHVVGGRVVQPHARSVLVLKTYESEIPPHTHQSGPGVMAVQVWWGSTAWEHTKVAVTVVKRDVAIVEDAWPVAKAGEMPLVIPRIAATSVGDIPAAVPPDRSPSPTKMAAAVEAGKASAPVRNYI